VAAPVQISARAVRNAFEVAEQWLAVNRDGVNAINVYPVPDGDTGTNMLATWRAALRAAPHEPEHVGEFFAALSRGALLGARGNSGVILSQMIRGMSEALAGRAEIDAGALVAAMQGAAATAEAAMSNPVEGTMLTVMRDAGAAAGVAAEQSAEPLAALAAAAEAAYESVRRTPELLATLRDAGVVDAGGMGIAVLLHGVTASLTGESLPEGPLVTSGARVDLSAVEHEGHGYCTEFLIDGRELDRAWLEGELEAAGGDSILVVGTAETVHVHVHMEDPGPALSIGARVGALDNVKVENMQAQHDRWAQEREQQERTPDPAQLPALGLVAVAPGPGIAAAFSDLGAGRVIEAWESGKASAGEILEAARQAGRNHVVVLPNDRDVLLAAQRAEEEAGGFITVIPTRHIPAGLAATIAYIPGGDATGIIDSMRMAAESARCVQVATAVRDATIDGISVREGEPIVMLDGRMLATAPTLADALMHGLHEAGARNAEVVTLYLGADADQESSEDLAAAIAEAFPETEVEVLEGGQPYYPYIAGIE
jgi:uncharacterized protein